MNAEARDLTIEELAGLAGVSVRTIRFYITEGLLPGPGARGKQASYGEEHILRLRLIRRLADERVPLAEQKERLAGLTTTEVRDLLAEAEERQEERVEARDAPSPKEYIATLLRQAKSARPRPSIPPSAPPPSAPPPPATLEHAIPDRQTYDRWELAPGVELHVSDAARSREADLIDRVLRAARRLRRT